MTVKNILAVSIFYHVIVRLVFPYIGLDNILIRKFNIFSLEVLNLSLGMYCFKQLVLLICKSINENERMKKDIKKYRDIQRKNNNDGNY